MLAKLEGHYEKLRGEKADVETKFSFMEDMELAAKFLELVGAGLRKCKEDGLTYLKSEVVSGGMEFRQRGTASTTKKETVMLPRFSKDKTTSYLEYPV